MNQFAYWLSDHITYRIGLRRCYMCGRWGFGYYHTLYNNRWVVECVECACK